MKIYRVKFFSEFNRSASGNMSSQGRSEIEFLAVGEHDIYELMKIAEKKMNQQRMPLGRIDPHNVTVEFIGTALTVKLERDVTEKIHWIHTDTGA